MKQDKNSVGTLVITGGDTARTSRYVSQAEKAAVRAEQSAAAAEAWAVGESGGIPVGSTDETFHNNARHFAEHAAASAASTQIARTAAESAANAAQSAKDDAEAAAQSVAGSAAQIQSNKQDTDDLKSAVFVDKPLLDVWSAGYRWHGANGNASVNSKYIVSDKFFPANYANSAISVRALPGYLFVLSCWDVITGDYVGMWNGSGFQKSTTVKHSYVRLSDVGTGYKFALSVCTENMDVDLSVDAGANILFGFSLISENSSGIAAINNELAKHRTITNKTGLFEAQQAIASDWHFPFINVYDALGLGNNHRIPGTAKAWDESNTNDLTQKGVWMSDGTHPYRGVGLVDMYGRTIANQLALISPSYHDGAGLTTPSYWAGKTLLWMGTSIPAGSDPDSGSGTGATYPALVANQLGATVINKAKGSSMLRIKSTTGMYNGIPFSHYTRAITRTIAECDEIAADWANIYPNVPNAPSVLTPEAVNVMKEHSFENLILPYLNGTQGTPDMWVIDYGHNDYANGIDGKRDWWITPSAENIESGLLAEDTYMTRDNYANLKLAFNNDLTGIPDLSTFAASVNRNCFQGACNFLITLILRYMPYARIAVISDYN